MPRLSAAPLGDERAGASPEPSKRFVSRTYLPSPPAVTAGSPRTTTGRSIEALGRDAAAASGSGA
jgi:hypothetical protein